MQLKFDDIVRRAGLDESTAQYVLKSKSLPGTPPGGRGRHRVFNFEQAFRVSVVTRLVMRGVPLRGAIALVEFCYQQLTGADGHMTWDSWRKEWMRPGLLVELHIADDETARLQWIVWYKVRREECFSISSREPVDTQADPEPISHYVIYLTRLAAAIGLMPLRFDSRSKMSSSDELTTAKVVPSRGNREPK